MDTVAQFSQGPVRLLRRQNEKSALAREDSHQDMPLDVHFVSPAPVCYFWAVGETGRSPLL